MTNEHRVVFALSDLTAIHLHAACLEAIRTSLQNASRDTMPVDLLFELDENGARRGG